MINYLLITKPGIILGNLITVAAGFMLASKGNFDIPLFLFTLLGIALIIGSACVFNNVIDKPLDRKMNRTKNRPLVTGLISNQKALFFGTLLGALGVLILFFFTNPVATLTACFGFFVYVILYSGWKAHTLYGTAIGSIAGAVPPVVGYTAVSQTLDLGALLFFIILIFWQMPHFFAIALYHLEDYRKAGIPLLPLKKGIFRTKVHMALYIVGFIITTSLLTWFHYTGFVYLSIALLTGLSWLALCLAGFKQENSIIWGRQMFRLSLVVITAICVATIF